MRQNPDFDLIPGGQVTNTKGTARRAPRTIAALSEYRIRARDRGRPLGEILEAAMRVCESPATIKGPEEVHSRGRSGGRPT